jgi:hypothetical protein
MRIIEFSAENFAKLKVVTIRPDKGLVVLSGRNRQGKSSALNAISTALQGLSAAPAEPIHEGCERSRVRLELGGEEVEMIVTRTFTVDPEEPRGWTSSFDVRTGAGAKVKSPQDALNAILGKIAFDPLSFSRADDDDKLKMLRPLVPEVDFDAEKAARAKDYDARTLVNAEAKRLRSQAEAVILPPGPVPARIAFQELEDELAGAAQFNAEIETRKANRSAARAQAEQLTAEVLELRDRLAYAEEKLATIEAKLATAEPLAEPKDILAIRARLTEARTKNEVADKAARKIALATEAAAAETKALALTKAIEARDAANAAAVAKAVDRVPGLTFAAGRLMLNGHAFSMASDAEQLEAAVAVAGLLNPTLRVVRIRDGSLLDEDAMAALERIAERLDLQVWLEVVSNTGDVGFVLEDGELKGPGTKPAPRPNFRADLAMAHMAARLPASTDPDDEVIV